MKKLKLLKEITDYGFTREAGTVIEVDDPTAKFLEENGFAVLANSKTKLETKVEPVVETVIETESSKGES